MLGYLAYLCSAGEAFLSPMSEGLWRCKVAVVVLRGLTALVDATQQASTALMLPSPICKEYCCRVSVLQC
jgi:hypothetical protein